MSSRKATDGSPLVQNIIDSHSMADGRTNRAGFKIKLEQTERLISSRCNNDQFQLDTNQLISGAERSISPIEKTKSTV